MEDKHWIRTIFVSLGIFILYILFVGARNFGDVSKTAKLFYDVYFSHPEKIAVAMLVGLFVGLTFWLIQYLGRNRPKSGFTMYFRAFEIMLVLAVIVWGLGQVLEFFVTHR